MKSASEIISEVLRREGSRYTNNPADKGGPTKYGITQKTLGEYRGHPVSAEDVAALTETEARSIYFQLYVRGPGFSKIVDERLMGLAVDCGVLHGRRRSIGWLQEIVGVRDDGILGPITADAINRKDPKDIYSRLNARRVRFFGEIITSDWKRAMEKARSTPGLADDLALSKLQAMFAGGWLNRAAEFIE